VRGVQGDLTRGADQPDGVETWHLADFTDVKRTKITRKISSG
jgi:hypothetical protein